MNSKRLAQSCRSYADNRKGDDPVVLDVRELSTVTDFFVIVSGTSDPHVRAIVEEITERSREDLHMRPRSVDGVPPTSWIVLDFLDVIVHVMTPEIREKYDLESLWGDAPRVEAARSPVSEATAVNS